MLALAVVPVLAVVPTQPAQAQTFTLLHSFTGGKDGGYPYAGLVRDAAGNLYGTAEYGGAGYGVVFKVSSSGTETVLHTFAGGKDGKYPFAGLVREPNGTIFGTTAYGGSSGAGIVFELSKSGKETVLHTFAGGTADGCNPYGGLIRDAAGNLYGTTEFCGASGYGTVFKIDTTGTETLLHSFAGGASDGAYPLWTSLLRDKKGDFYGVTDEGGTSGEGVVYMLSSSGTLTVLHAFAGGTADGCNPFGTPAMDNAGNLYGSAELCGSRNKGIVWELSTAGTETVLHSFIGRSTDGAYPGSGVILDAQGNLYGDTEGGDAFGLGAVYELNQNGTLTLLHGFNGPDGDTPFGGVTLDGTGNLYGTSFAGGVQGSGTVWKVTP